jgi:hypothetical protein
LTALDHDKLWPPVRTRHSFHVFGSTDAHRRPLDELPDRIAEWSGNVRRGVSRCVRIVGTSARIIR